MEISFFLVRFFLNLTNSWKWKIFLHTIKKHHNSWHSSVKTLDVSVYVAPYTCSPCENLLRLKFFLKISGSLISQRHQFQIQFVCMTWATFSGVLLSTQPAFWVQLSCEFWHHRWNISWHWGRSAGHHAASSAESQGAMAPISWQWDATTQFWQKPNHSFYESSSWHTLLLLLIGIYQQRKF